MNATLTRQIFHTANLNNTNITEQFRQLSRHAPCCFRSPLFSLPTLFTTVLMSDIIKVRHRMICVVEVTFYLQWNLFMINIDRI